ncbi:MAG TPA: hypothetical protein VIF64_10315, partial [Pyrinomonadaceae bacterium]
MISLLVIGFEELVIAHYTLVAVGPLAPEYVSVLFAKVYKSARHNQYQSMGAARLPHRAVRLCLTAIFQILPEATPPNEA